MGEFGDGKCFTVNWIKIIPLREQASKRSNDRTNVRMKKGSDNKNSIYQWFRLLANIYGHVRIHFSTYTYSKWLVIHYYFTFYCVGVCVFHAPCHCFEMKTFKELRTGEIHFEMSFELHAINHLTVSKFSIRLLLVTVGVALFVVVDVFLVFFLFLLLLHF